MATPWNARSPLALLLGYSGSSKTADKQKTPEEKEAATQKKKYSDFTDEQIVGALAFANFSPDNKGPTNPILNSRLTTEATRRGIDLTTIPKFSSFSEAFPYINVYSNVTGSEQSSVLEKFSTHFGIATSEKEIARRDKAIQSAQNALDEFVENKDYDNLISKVRELPSSLPPEQVKRLKTVAVSQARTDEAARQRKIRSNIGVRGFGGAGGSIAALAEMSAADVDRRISEAFMELDIQAEAAKRDDMMGALAFESQLTGDKGRMRSLYEGNVLNATAGLPALSPGDSASDYAAFLEAMRAARKAERLGAEQSSNAMLGSIIQGVGTIAGGALGGHFGAALGSAVFGAAGQAATK